VITADASPPRPLPIRPRPASGESPAGYLRRLARANHLRPGYLRRYLSLAGSPDTISLDGLAILAGRPACVLERALTGQDTGRPQARKAERLRLFAAIRADARAGELSLRALADRHGVHRRTVRQALESPWPAPRRQLPGRGSRLDPFKGTIASMLAAPPAGTARLTAREIHTRLISDHGMTGVSYSTVSNYLASHRLPGEPSATDRRALSRDAQRAVTRMKQALEAIQPGLAARLQTQIHELELEVGQAIMHEELKTTRADTVSANLTHRRPAER
jgi:transposase